MGGNVSIKNETPYTWSYYYSYYGTSSTCVGNGTVGAWGERSHGQKDFNSYIYIKCGDHDAYTVYRQKDLMFYYHASSKPTFTIREAAYNPSLIELVCSNGGDRPTCPNHEKIKNDWKEQQRRQEEQRKQEEQRRQEQEEKRRLERLERERKIQEQIDRESEECERKLAHAAEKQKLSQSFRGQERHHQRSHILHNLVEDDADSIHIDEIRETEKKFNDLLLKHQIQEDESIKCSEIEDRMKILQNVLTAQYCTEKNLSIWSQFTFDSAISYEQLSLTEKLCVLEAIVLLTVEDTSEILSEMQHRTNCDDKYGFLLLLLVKMSRKNATLAGNLLLSVLDIFSELSYKSKELLSQILFSKIWTPLEIILFIRNAIDISQEQMVSILHTVQTYSLDLLTVISALKDEYPLKCLQGYAKKEEDKDLDIIVNEMLANNYPEQIVSIIEEVLSKVVKELPKYEKYDLDEKMKNDGIAMVKSLDLTNPNLETLSQVLIGLSIAVQDSSTILSESKEKIEGYFPRITQLASVMMLLLSPTPMPNNKGCLLEIGTGEGKSCILAMFATIQAIRGIKVDIVTSSPVLACRDKEEWEKLYEMFNITCSVVGLTDSTHSRKKGRLIAHPYEADVVYGTVGHFAADTLKQEFEKTKTRGDRKFDMVIVDEVDYMTLDNGVQVTFLSHEASGLRHVEQVLADIWAMVCACQPVELTDTGEIQWATRIQHFHKAAATAVMGSEISEHFTPYDILKPGLQLEFITQEDIERLHVAETEAEKENASAESKDQYLKVFEMIMAKIGFAEQHDLLTIFEKVLDDAINFECYTVADGLAVPFKAERKSSDVKIKMLLMKNGLACEILTEEALVDATVAELKSRIKYSDTYGPDTEVFILIPFFLREYVENRLPVFVKNALKAISMTQGREYMIDCTYKLPQNSEKHHLHGIIPVDFKASGVLEKNKRWGEGLQQFLEMKHQLAISPLSNVTNYLSNFHYFQRYLKGTGIYGVSGTLGEKADIDFLQKKYETATYVIPAHRHNKVVELPAIQVRGGRDQWIQTISKCIMKVTCRGQVVLVVCEDVKTADELGQKLIDFELFPKDKITMYTISDKHNIEKITFTAGRVIIATNLGGRGTDIKVDKNVNQCGGLCVILTHFPSNRRVEKQVFGRTARKGNPGMVQMILNCEDLAEAYQGQPVEIMRELRAEYEVNRIADMENDELLEINMREELFAHFCEHLNSFEKKYTEEERTEVSTMHVIPPFLKSHRKKFDYQPALNTLKESWALWLTLHEKQIDDHVNIIDLKSDLSELFDQTAKKLLLGESNNFYDNIKQAMNRTYLHTKDHTTDYGAIEYWENAIQSDRKFRAASLYNQAFIKINLGIKDYKKEAISLLEDALSAVDVYISEATNIMIACQMSCVAKFEPHHKNGTNFQRQMETRVNLFKSWQGYIKKALEKLKELENNKQEAITKDSSVYHLSTEKDYIVTNELVALHEKGLGLVFEVEKKPEFCIDALICAIIGVCQVFAGVLVCALSFGMASQIGMGLISDGVSDMITGIEGMAKGTFDWADWAISKAISLGMSLVTAGFNCIRRAVTSVCKATKSLLTGAKTFTSIADDAIRTGKNTFSSVKGTVKSTASSLTRTTFENSMKKLTSSSVVTSSFKQAAKYAGQEIGKQAVTTVLKHATDQALSEAFKKILKEAFDDCITRAVIENADLDKSLTRFIIAFGIPEAASQKDTNDFKIPDESKKKMKNLVEGSCDNVVSELMTDNTKLKEVISRLSEVHDNASQLMQKAKVPGVIQKVLNFSVEIEKHASQFIQILNSIPTKSIIDTHFVREFIKSLDEIVKADGEYKEDTRSSFPEVKNVKTEILKLIANKVSSAFLETCSSHMTSFMTLRFRKKLNQAAGSAVGNILGRYKTQRFFDDLKHSQNMKTAIQRTSKSQSDSSSKEMKDYVQNISDVNRPATVLDLHVITKSDLLQGKGIKITVVDQDGKELSSESYPGKDSLAGDITLRLTKEQQKSESEKGFLSKVKQRILGKQNPYSGHFDLVKADGTVIPVNSNNQNCLYHAIIQATDQGHGKDINYQAVELRKKVRDEVLKDFDSYAEVVKLQLGYEKSYTVIGKYTITGGTKRKAIENNKNDERLQQLKKNKHLCDYDVICTYNLGVVSKYKSLRKFNGNGEKFHQRHMIEADHIPPKDVLKKALEKIKADPNIDATLKKNSPHVHTFLAKLKNDPSGRELLCMNVVYHHHRVALTTGRSNASDNCRMLMGETLLSGNPEKMLKQAFILAHPLASQQLREDAGIGRAEIMKRMDSLSNDGTNCYYKQGYHRLIWQYFSEHEIISQNQRDSLLSWVENGGYEDKNTEEYKEILQCISD